MIGKRARQALIASLACLACTVSLVRAVPRTITGALSNGSVKLAATLDLPDGPGPHPVVVVLHASGAGERGFASYRHLAQVLPANGIGVARYDRRGSGASTGDFERASFSDLASDARTVVGWVREFDSVDPRRIALWGMSQGGWIAPLVAGEDPSIAAVVIVSGAGGTPAEQMIFTARTALREAGYPKKIVERAVRLRRAVDEYYAGRKTREEVAALLAAARTKPWYRFTFLPDEPPRDVKSSKWYYQLAFDPAGSIAQIHAPVLLLFGERDPWIPVDESIAAWKARAKTDLTVRRIPGANHFMARATDPAHDGDPEPVSEEYTRVMTEWLARVLGTRSLTRRPVGQVLPAGVGPVKELHFAKEFQYVGGQRFILKKVADAEQHFFVEMSQPGTVRRLYWIQFERYLPGIGEGYDYSADEAVSIGGIPFRRNARRWDSPPDPDSDRAAMYAFLEKAGYRVPDGAVRVRLVHVPDSNRREELMIIYAEAPEPGEATPPSETDVQRYALEGLRVVAAAP